VSVIAIIRMPIFVRFGIGMVLSVPYRFIKRRHLKPRRYITRACAAAAAGIALTAVGVTAASASVTAPRAMQTVRVAGAGASVAAASPGAQLWVARYDNGGNGGATSAAASPNGKTMFVTGYVTTASGTEDYTTVAYNAATGAQLWAARYTDPGHSSDRAYSVAVSPDGNTVFVTGTSLTATSYYYATVAYNAATGAQQWVARYEIANPYGAPSVGAVSPDGTKVFVTGTSDESDYTTVAYNAVTGAQLWVARYGGVAGGGSYASSVVVSRDGTKVFVTGASIGTNDAYGYATVAYNAVTGAQLWAERYDGVAGGGSERGATSVAVSASTVFVTGSSYGGSTTSYDYATVAYSATTGAQLWVKRYNGPGSGDDQAYSVAVSPNGKAVFVTGYSEGAAESRAYATVAYNAATGAQLWVKRYNGPGNFGEAYSVAVSPNGSTVYVTGYSYGSVEGGEGYATIAYDAATGAQLWAARYSPPAPPGVARSVAVSPTTGTVFVTGDGTAAGSGFDYFTVAYQG
jgi:outer membrane protein assembly factor BamB